MEALAQAKDALEADLRGEISTREEHIGSLEADLDALDQAKDALEAELSGQVEARDGRIAGLER